MTQPAPAPGFPLSSLQREVWLEHSLQPDSPLSNVAGYTPIQYPVDLDLFRRTLDCLVQRHDVLRMRLVQAEGEDMPRLHVLDAVQVEVPYRDISAAPDPEALAMAIMKGEVAQPFDLKRPVPLFRWQLLKLGERLYYWIKCYHHLIVDGWTTGLLARTMGEIYDALEQGQVVETDSAFKYTDFIEGERPDTGSERERRDRAFWEMRFPDLPEALFPPRYPLAAAERIVNSDCITIGLPRSLLVRLAASAEELHCSVAHLFIAGFHVTFARLRRRDEIVVGLPVLNRPTARFKQTAGLFAKISPVRLRFDMETGFDTLLAGIREELAQTYRHQRFPLSEVNQLAGLRGTGRRQLFDFLVSYETQSYGKAFGIDGEMRTIVVLPDHMHTPLSVFIRDYGEDVINVNFGYRLDCFRPEEIRQIQNGLLQVLEEAMARPQTPLSRFNLLTGADRAQLSAWDRERGVEPPREDLPGLFEAQVLRTPDRIALRAGGESLSYGELDRRANRLAHRLLREAGAGDLAGQLIGVALSRGPNLLVSLLAIHKAGAAYVPLDAAYPRERLAFMARSADLALILSEPDLAPQLPRTACPVLFVTDREDERAGLPDTPPPANRDPSRLAYVLFTSGSTGEPKGVMIEHRSAATLVRWALGRFDHELFAGTLASTSLNFDLSVFELFVPLACGGTVVLVRDALALIGSPVRGGITFINTVPSAIDELLRAGAIPHSVRTVALAGEALQRRLVDALYALDHVEGVYNLYGPTEDTTYSTWARLARDDVGEPVIGHPVDGTSAHILDAVLEPLPVGVAGELCLGGLGLARGYLNRPDLTQERFFTTADGRRLYRTGDLARWRADGELEYLGRFDSQIKLRGFRIELGEIEARLARHPGVADAAVLVAEGASGPALAAYYTIVPGAPAVGSAVLRGWVAQSLPDYMVPARFILLNAMPRTPNGKLDRRALPAPDADTSHSPGGRDRFASPTEELLAGMWAELLDCPDIGPEDDFLALGGHSLLALRLAERARAALNVNLSPTILFEETVLREQARRIDQALGAPQLPPVLHDPDGEVAPTPPQLRLWFLDRMDSRNAAYNMPVALRLDGPLDVAALGGAFSALVARHDSLRMCFVEREGRPRIDWLAPYAPMLVVNLAHLPVDERTVQMECLIAEAAEEPFDLEAGPLLRAGLLVLSPEAHVLLLTLHHIIADGRSGVVLLDELSVLYANLRAGRDPAEGVMPPRMPYRDYARWLHQTATDAALEPLLEQTLQRLDGLPELLELPADRPRPAVLSTRGGVVKRHLPPSLVASLRHWGRSRQATLFMVILSAFQLLLHRHTGSRDLCVGSPIANRCLPDSADTVGLFVNTLALRARIDPAMTFDGLLQQTRGDCLKAYAAQELPFERVVERMRPGRSRSHAPLFQVMLALDGDPLAAFSLDGVEATRLEPSVHHARFDLTLAMTETADGVDCRWEFSRDLFDDDRIARMAGHFTALLSEILSGSDRPLHQFSLVTSGEWERMRDWGNGGAAPVEALSFIDALGMRDVGGPG